MRVYFMFYTKIYSFKCKQFFKWPLNSFVGYTYVNERDKILHKNIASDIISDFVFTKFFLY